MLQNIVGFFFSFLFLKVAFFVCGFGLKSFTSWCLLCDAKKKKIPSEVEINMYILLYIKQIGDKGLLYSTGESTQYFVISYMGKQSEQE